MDASSCNGEDEPERLSQQLQQDDSVEIFQQSCLDSGKFTLRRFSDLYHRLLLVISAISFK